MVIRTSPTPSHWNYLLAIERDLDRLSRFVEFDKRNFECFSLEMARILLAAGAETDVVCKQICAFVGQQTDAGNIHQYRDTLVSAHPAIPKFAVTIPRFGLDLHPWDEWNKTDGVPLWWTAYNKTKHQRNTHYELSNLKNVLNAVAGLFVATLYLYPDQARMGELVPVPQLLRPGADFVGGTTFGDFDMGFNYRLS
jgi:hypothetical protein